MEKQTKEKLDGKNVRGEKMTIETFRRMITNDLMAANALIITVMKSPKLVEAVTQEMYEGYRKDEEAKAQLKLELEKKKGGKDV